MHTLIGIVVGIVGLGFLVMVHEFGHFIVAKATGMRVEEFSLGFGPYLIKRRWGETIYGISAVPLGGYVRVTGMHKEEFEQRIEDLREQEAEEAALREEKPVEKVGNDMVGESAAVDARDLKRKRRFRDPEDALTGKRALTADEIAATPLRRRYYSHPLWHKLLFIVAGVAMNVIVAYVILYGVGVAKGTDVLPPVIAEVAVGSGAWDAGIEPGDVITSVAGHGISDWDQMAWEVVKHKGETVDISLLRDGVAQKLRADIRADQDGIGKLGVTPKADFVHQSIGWLGGFGYAGRLVGDTFLKIFQGIGMLFTRDVPATGSQGLMGVVGIVDFSAQVVQGGFAYYLNFLAFISLSLALMNILPLLPLDGGHVVMSVLERLRGRSVSLKVFERISLVGLALVAVLFVVAMYNDIGRIVTGG